MTASVFAEALQNGETLDTARARLSARDHLARNYKGLGISALAAAANAVRSHRHKSKTVGDEATRALADRLQQGD